ncbi:exodeoxyribonuclease VII small subunit [Granulicatella seriolae]|uniref:Exodeoxyribonuclease 7 small subunit n=1 Tax=Granulicatella seriolae TaxID=2967226 RepID=A0ABT1WNJ7_9LACT|nr:exodeoxyribonuclease VII small subunit [Granulicatella seriolae]
MPKKQASFEEALTQLDTIVKQLENGDVPLEEALKKFQEGIELSNYCNDILVKAEETVTQMVIQTDKPSQQEL